MARHRVFHQIIRLLAYTIRVLAMQQSHLNSFVFQRFFQLLLH